MTCSTDLAVWHGSHDGRIADALLDHLGRRITVLADKACDTDPIRQLIQDRGAKLNIPPRSTGAGSSASASGSTASAT
jgi:transposase